MSEETKNKISKANSGKFTGDKNPNYGGPYSLRGDKNPNYGKPMPEERKIKMRAIISDSRKGSKNANYGNHKLAGKNNPRCMPVYCVEFDRIFLGAKEA